MFDSLHNKLIKFITQNISRDELISINDAIISGYYDAYVSSKELVQNSNPSRLRSYSRRYLIDDRLAGLKTAKSNSVCMTSPRGEQYTVLELGDISLSHIEVNHTKKIRNAVHRNILSSKNSSFETLNLDLFNQDGPEIKEIDRMHLVAMVFHPNEIKHDQSKPSLVQLAVPYTDWKGFHLEIPISEMLEKYNETPNNNTKDLAWPKLKAEVVKREIKNA